MASTSIGISVLFTDLVDSTALSTSMGATEAETLRKAHFDILRAAVLDAGGHEVKTLGDGIMAVFTNVGAALDAAVAMQQAFHLRNESANESQLTIRVGVSCGDCIEEDGDYFGEPVVQAARLCAAASGDEVLAPEIVRALAPRGSYEFSPRGELNLKGIPEPVATVEVVWEPSDSVPLGSEAAAQIGSGRSVPLPPRLSRKQTLAFRGREAELDRLRDAWVRTRDGDRQVVLLSGEAGMGKTRLASELAGESFESGGLVLYGRCDEDVATPYRPWVEALSAYVTAAGAGTMAPLGATTVAELARLVPSLRRRAPASTTAAAATEGDQYTLYSAVTSLLIRLSRSQPLLLVLDDVHWADLGTLTLLRHVVAETPSARLACVVTYRETDLEAEGPVRTVLAALHRETGVTGVELEGLSESEILSILEGVAGHALGEQGNQLAGALHTETGGNPFFVGEMLRHLVETGTIEKRDGIWTSTEDLNAVGLPRSIRDLVDTRVRRLGDVSRQVLAAAACVGREFDAWLAASAADLDAYTVLACLERAAEAGLVIEVPNRYDRLTFSHALVQHTLYNQISRARKTRLHQRIAEAIETTAGEEIEERVDEIAEHWFAAGPQHVDRAVDYGLRAGDSALAARSPDDAVSWFERSLELLPEETTRRHCDTLIRLGDAQRQAGAPAYRETLLKAARLAQQLGDTDALVRAALANNRGWGSHTGEPDTERIQVLEAALRTNGDDSASRASLLALLAVELTATGDKTLDRRLSLADEAVDVARRVGDPAALAQVLGAGVFSTWIPERLATRDQWSTEAADLAASVGDPVLEFWTAARRDLVALETQDMSTYATYRARSIKLADGLHQPLIRWYSICVEVPRRFLEGDLEGAEVLATQALEIGLETGQPDAVPYYGAQLIQLRRMQGRLSELEDLVREHTAANPGVASFRVTLAGICASEGRYDEALDIVADDASSRLANFPRDPLWLINVTGIAWVAAAVGQSEAPERATDLARLVYEQLLPWSDRAIHIGIVAREPVAHFLGVLAATLGLDDEAEKYFATALEIEHRIGAVLYVASTQVERALFRTRRCHGDLSEARTDALAACRTAEMLNAGEVERRARQVLDELAGT